MTRYGHFRIMGGLLPTRRLYRPGGYQIGRNEPYSTRMSCEKNPIAGTFMVGLFLLMLLIPMGTLPMTVSGQESDEILLVRVGAYENPPKVFTDDNGDVRGFFPDVIEYIAAEEGWGLEYVHGSWTECLTRLENNEIDIMVDVAVSAERREIFDFTNESMLLSWGVVYARPDSDIQSIPDLDGKRVAVMRESIHTVGEEGIQSTIEKFQLNVTYIEFDNYTAVFESLDNGEADVGVVDRIFAGTFEDDYDVVRTPIIFNPADLRYAFPKNATISPFLIERLDYNLVQLKMDPDSIYYQSLNTYIPNLFEDEREAPGWLMPVLLLSFGVLAVIVSMNFLLRRQVKTRTAELHAAGDGRVNEENRADFYLDLMSHDIANICQGVYTYAELADEESADNENLHLYTTGILGLTRRAVRLIGAVRILSRLGKEERDFKPVCLISSMNDCIEAILKTFPEEDIKIKFDPPCKEVLVLAEPLIHSLFLTVLDNAVRHQRGKEKKIEIDIDRNPGGGSVSVCISDHGPGIPDEVKQTLFHRSAKLSDRRLTGIGLALARELVERYNGTIKVIDRVEGDYAQGARFVISIPTEY